MGCQKAGKGRRTTPRPPINDIMGPRGYGVPGLQNCFGFWRRQREMFLVCLGGCLPWGRLQSLHLGVVWGMCFVSFVLG